MFTGLIEGMAVVKSLQAEPAGILIAILPPPNMLAVNLPDHLPTRIGDSVSINGCCLTIVSINEHCWSFQAGKETLSKTGLGELQPGDSVNLERALPANGRLGGHFVQGHVDGTGTVDQIDRDSDWVTMGFRIPASLAELMVPKGSVAVDGVSLTVVTVDSARFTVALIPHTLAATTLGQRTHGKTVNIETDILGKYARKFLDQTATTG